MRRSAPLRLLCVFAGVAALAGAAAVPGVALAGTAPSPAVVPNAGSTKTVTWSGAIPVGSTNPDGRCSTRIDTTDVALTVPAGLYDAATTSATWSISWTPSDPSAANNEMLTLVDPQGTIVGDANQANSGSGAQMESLRTTNPVAGTWKVRACGFSSATQQQYTGALVLTTSVSSEPPPPVDTTSPFGRLTCVPQLDGPRFCEGSIATRVPSFDGVPLDVNVALPPTASANLPLVVLSHGYSGAKSDYPGMRAWVKAGYAVLAITARGFGESCGSPESRQADPEGCAAGWVRLDDTRYEVRDIQTLAGLLADEGIVDGQRVGLVGGSYGGGVSVAGAVLRDRIMDVDGTLKPWRSPGGKSMRIAGAAPSATWTDLLYALAPNGRTLDYLVTGPDDNAHPYGITKAGMATLFGASGARDGYYGPDITRLTAQLATSGDQPRNPAHDSFVDEMTRFHSSYYLLDGTTPPAPLLLTNGFTDDIFPVDEAVRLYNKVRSLWPAHPISLRFSDTGHFRAQKKTTDDIAQTAAIRGWIDYYVKGTGGAAPFLGVSAYTQTCPAEAPMGGPFLASTWAGLHPGEVRGTFPSAQTVLSSGGDPQTAAALTPAFIPLTPVNTKACDLTADADEPGTATYRIPFQESATMIGSPTVIADVTVAGGFGQIATRLFDVDPETGMQTLIARGLYRPDSTGRQVFQLHPGAWTFEAGHEAKLQLLGQDAPYGAPDRAPFSIAVSDLELRLPTVNPPNGRQVLVPAQPVIPAGGVLAAPVVPEVPYAVLLPVMIAALFAITVRRRSKLAAGN